VQSAARDIETSVSSAARDFEQSAQSIGDDLNRAGDPPVGSASSLSPLQEPPAATSDAAEPDAGGETSRQGNLPGFEKI
jgi:hypothetical protein